MKWFRFYSEFMDDPKISMMNDSDQLLWVKALCLAGDSAQRGTILLTDAEICWKLRISHEQWQSAIDKFRAKGMIEHCSEGYKICNWGKRQFVSDDVTARTTAHKKKKGTEKERSQEQKENVLRTDTDPEQNTDPDQSKADPERAVQVCDQKFDFSEQPTATEQKSQLTAEPLQIIPEQNLTQEITAIPPRIATENDQQAVSTLSRNVIPVYQKSGILQGQIAADHRETLINEAIDTYNQYRGAWGECVELPEGYRNRLYQIFYRQKAEDKRGAFLALIRDATLWVARSQWLAKPEFESKNFLFLIGRQLNEKIAEYAASWRSLSDDLKVGTVIKISQPKAKEWCNLKGNPCSQAEAHMIWYATARKAKKEPDKLTRIELDYVAYYFPDHDIYTKVELHD